MNHVWLDFSVSDSFFANADELKAAFNLGPDSPYEGYTPLIDDKVGFSIQRRYPPSIRFKPPLRRDGSPDTVAMIQVLYPHPSKTKMSFPASKVPLTFRVLPYSRCLAKRDGRPPTKESIRLSRSTPRPLELESEGQYAYNHHKQQFQDRRGRALEGTQILDRLFQLHCDSVHLLKGLRLRWKRRWGLVLLNTLDCLVRFLKFVMRTLLGRAVQPENPLAAVLHGYRPQDIKVVRTKPISVFGYEASRNVIMTFSFTVVLVYTIGQVTGWSCPYLSALASNALLALCSSLIIIWLLDNAVPAFLLKLLNWVIRSRMKLFKF